MGIIKRQVLKNNAVSIVGVGLGVLSNLFIYPMAPEVKGFIEGVIRSAQLLVPFLMLGLTTVMIRFLPYLKEQGEKLMAGRLFTWSWLIISIGSIFFGLAWWLVGIDLIKSHFNIQPDSPIVKTPWLVFSVTVLIVYAGLLTANLVNFRRITVPVIFNNLLLKVATPLVFLGFIYHYLSLETFNLGIGLLYLFPVIGLLIYSWQAGFLHINFGRITADPKLKKEMVSLAGFSVLGAIGSRLAINIDIFSVSAAIGNSETGIYSLATFLMGVIAIPSVAINTISAPIIAQEWKDRNFEELGKLYKETSSVLFASGGLIYVGALVCMPYLYDVMENLEQYRTGYLALLLLGGAQLFDLLTSINGNLIAMTDYYRWNVFFILVLGFLTVFLNYIFIGVWDMGMTGAALGTVFAIFIFNVAKAIFIQVKMGIQPLSKSTFYTLGALIVTGSLGYFTPAIGHPLLEILVRGSLIVFFFFIYLRFTNGVPAIKRMLADGIKNMFR